MQKNLHETSMKHRRRRSTLVHPENGSQIDDTSPTMKAARIQNVHLTRFECGSKAIRRFQIADFGKFINYALWTLYRSSPASTLNDFKTKTPASSVAIRDIVLNKKLILGRHGKTWLGRREFHDPTLHDGLDEILNGSTAGRLGVLTRASVSYAYTMRINRLTPDFQTAGKVPRLASVLANCERVTASCKSRARRQHGENNFSLGQSGR